MTEQQVKFLKAAKEYEALKDQLNAANEELFASMSQLTLGTYIQDPETKLVYCIRKPKGVLLPIKI
jgi:hypothetical protein